MMYLRKYGGSGVSRERLPPTRHNPSISSLTSSFLLPLLPCCPAFSSQNPSPINLPFSTLARLLWLLKTSVSGIAKTLIFDHLHLHHPLYPVSVSWLRGFPHIAPLWLLEIGHAWSPQSFMDMLLYSLLRLLFITRVHSYDAQVRMQTETFEHSWACCHILPISISRGVNGGMLLRIGDFNSILTRCICLCSAREKYAIGCFSPCHSCRRRCQIKWTVFCTACSDSVDFVSCVMYSRRWWR